VPAPFELRAPVKIRERLPILLGPDEKLKLLAIQNSKNRLETQSSTCLGGIPRSPETPGGNLANGSTTTPGISNSEELQPKATEAHRTTHLLRDPRELVSQVNTFFRLACAIHGSRSRRRGLAHSFRRGNLPSSATSDAENDVPDSLELPANVTTRGLLRLNSRKTLRR